MSRPTSGAARPAVSVLTVDDGARVELGALVATAGEGSVYEVTGRRDLVAKVFHPTLSGLAEKLDKVAAMVDSPPPGAVQADGFVVLTWPQHVVSESGRPVGYLMPRIDTTTAVEIHSMSNPFNRANPLPGAPQWTANATWEHLVNVAANLCLAVQVVHRVDAVIGDFQERNILVSDTTRVTLVDCDSIQFTDASGRQFLCGVGRPEFTAPELAAVDLRTQPRGKLSDLFALAVHIYQLLMGGNHPFMRGVWTGGGDQPSALSLAKAGHWAGGPGSPLGTHPLAPPPSFLPADIAAFFTRAFTDGARDPAARPSAAQWRDALQKIHTTTCPRGSHLIPTTTLACPWCAIDNERARRKQHSASGGAGGIDEQVVYRVRPAAKRPPTTANTTAGSPGLRHERAGIATGLPSAPSPLRRPIVVSLLAVALVIAGVLIGLAARNTGANTTGAPAATGYRTPSETTQYGAPTTAGTYPSAPTTLAPSAQLPAATPVATFDGYASVKIGMTQAEATTALGPAPNNHFFNCTVFGQNTINALKVWIADSSGRVTGIETPPGTVTDRGVGDGSTPSEIRAAYSGPGYTIDEGNTGGQGMPAINVFAGPKDYTGHRLLSFLIGDNGRSEPPSVGRPKAWEGC